MGCAAGEVCSGGMCTLSCGGGLTDCGGVCRDPSTDRLHCGGCGMACAAGEVCSGGMCAASCGMGLTECGGSCVDTRFDPRNCGGCSVACTSSQLCDAGTCRDRNPTISCGGYAYPETTLVAPTSCTGWFASCTGTREFRAVGCYTSNPGDVCPPGFSPATLMLIGQWAQAANITRYVSGTSVCAWSNGSSAGTVCGGSGPHSNYCWPRGDGCYASCPSNCCPPTGPCTATAGYESPLLCVRT